MDHKTWMQARALANVRYRYIMDLCTGGVDRTDAINCIILRTKQIDRYATRVGPRNRVNTRRDNNKRSVLDIQIMILKQKNLLWYQAAIEESTWGERSKRIPWRAYALLGRTYHLLLSSIVMTCHDYWIIEDWRQVVSSGKKWSEILLVSILLTLLLDIPLLLPLHPEFH